MSLENKQSVAINPTRENDFPEWYQQVIKAADLAENSAVRGCMIIKPYGFALWENIQKYLNDRIQKTGHQNAYFPLFIPLRELEKEASHVEGFAKECAVVTHHRLEGHDGKLVPAGELEEPLIVRPTSEMIIGESFSRWISSYRDLPLKINQWANVVRWEMRPRIFLRTSEFLWQEGHTAHATEQEAIEEADLMLEEYRRLMEDQLALPVIVGSKSPGERFPGAVDTMTLECMTQDRKAIQCGTSHYLGQNFAKACGIRFTTKEGSLQYAYTTSWGATTRLIGAMIMVHGDDNGLRIPPKIAPYHVVIIPILNQKEHNEAVLAQCSLLQEKLSSIQYNGEPVRVHTDLQDARSGDKSWTSIKKGVPIRIEMGPRDIASKSCMVGLRTDTLLKKNAVTIDDLVHNLPQMLEEIQNSLYQEALAFRQQNTRTDISSFEEMRKFFTPKDEEKPEIHGGFVRAKWCGDIETEETLKQMKVTIRCLPFDQSKTKGKCIITGKEATLDAIFAKSY